MAIEGQKKAADNAALFEICKDPQDETMPEAELSTNDLCQAHADFLHVFHEEAKTWSRPI